MAEIIDLERRRTAQGTSDVRELAAVPARDLQELRAKARLLRLCRDPADALFLYAHILADIEMLADAASPGEGWH